MRILHTSDWHLGRTLYGRKRYDEFAAFLDWLAEVIEQEGVAALLVAGDVFDTSAPSHRAQELYYRFLCRVAASPCRHVVVVAGNHDSPTFLDAPKELLRALDVHVIGSAAEDPADEVLVLSDPAGVPELIVCAVPYLRDRDIRQVEAGEDSVEKESKLIEGIRDHYARVTALAEARRAELGADIPLVAMGHLFTAGGQTLDGDGVRELYVGSLAHVSSGIFPDSLDYLALGHLHVPQQVGGAETRRYSGSPLPMGFGEARQEKSLCLVEWGASTANSSPTLGADVGRKPKNAFSPLSPALPHEGGGRTQEPALTNSPSSGGGMLGGGGLTGYEPNTGLRQDTDPLTHVVTDREKVGRPACRVRLIPIPVFQPLERIQGDWDRLAARLNELLESRSPAWIEIIYAGEDLISDLRERLEEILSRAGDAAAGLEILRVRNNRLIQKVMQQITDEESLSDLDELEVFARCLEAQDDVAEQQADLLRAYQEILASFHQGDPMAE